MRNANFTKLSKKKRVGQKMNLAQKSLSSDTVSEMYSGNVKWLNLNKTAPGYV